MWRGGSPELLQRFLPNSDMIEKVRPHKPSHLVELVADFLQAPQGVYVALFTGLLVQEPSPGRGQQDLLQGSNRKADTVDSFGHFERYVEGNMELFDAIRSV